MKKVSAVLLAIGGTLVTATSALASSSSGMPWEAPLQTILTSLSGPTVKIIGTIAIVICGLALALGEGGGGLKKGIQIVLGLSIALTAASFLTSLFGSSSGVAF